MVEAISVVVVIGLSVDYVVHMSNAYLDNELSTRVERGSFSLSTMGATVMSGAVSTFGAGFWLMFMAMLMFKRIGYIMCFVIFFSITWSLFYFSAAMFWLGPEGDDYAVVKSCGRQA